jgi:hypothetical protein
MEMCPKCGEPREMRIAVERRTEPDDNSTERTVEITTLGSVLISRASGVAVGSFSSGAALTRMRFERASRVWTTMSRDCCCAYWTSSRGGDRLLRQPSRLSPC